MKIPGQLSLEINTKAIGAINLDLRDSYAQFGHVRHTGKGVVRTRAA